MKVFKGDDTKRQAPPHPSNSGGDALRAGIKQLKANHAESSRPMPKKEAK
jgi:hypothetical protein